MHPGLASKANYIDLALSSLGRGTSMYFRKCYDKQEVDIRIARPKWTSKDLTELKEAVAESHFLIVTKDVKFTTKAQLRILDGQLSTRNREMSSA